MYTFDDFSNDLENIIDNQKNYEHIIRESYEPMKKLLSNRTLISKNLIDDILAGKADNTVYTSSKNDFTIQIFPWEAHSSTPVHDHGTWGIIGVYYNELFISEYDMNQINHSSYEINVNKEYLAKEGNLCYVLPPHDEIHKVGNQTDSLSISIHVYGKVIKEYNIYDLENGNIVHTVV